LLEFRLRKRLIVLRLGLIKASHCNLPRRDNAKRLLGVVPIVGGLYSVTALRKNKKEGDSVY